MDSHVDCPSSKKEGEQRLKSVSLSQVQQADAIANGSSSTEEGSPPSSGDVLADSEGLDEDDEDWEGSGMQCEVCMAESWWRMAALQHQQRRRDQRKNTGSESSSSSEDKGGERPTLSVPEPDFINMAALMMFYSPGGMDFSITKLREFYESQKAGGLPEFPLDFDEFWLLVVKARLAMLARRKGPVVYNRIVTKIRNIIHKFMARVEERERKEAGIDGSDRNTASPPEKIENSN